MSRTIGGVTSFAINLQRRLPAFELDVAFKSGPGVTAIIGPSGAGKTMLVSAIAGLVRPDAGKIEQGEVVLFDSAAGIDKPPEMRGCGFVFQDARLFPHRSVSENLTYARPRGEGEAPAVTFDEVIALLDLGGLLTRRPHGLSGGEKQRVAIGRALLSHPRFLIFDEPLSSLDAPRRAEILPFIEALKMRVGLPIIYVSHNIEEVVRLSDYVVAMDNGRVVATGEALDVLNRVELQPLMTLGDDPGTVIEVRVERHDPHFHLTALRAPGGLIYVPEMNQPVGTSVRLRIHARDVSLSCSEPRDLSIQNQLSGTVDAIKPAGKGQLLVRVRLSANTGLWARITTKAQDALGVEDGQRIWALVKTVSLTSTVGP